MNAELELDIFDLFEDVPETDDVDESECEDAVLGDWFANSVAEPTSGIDVFHDFVPEEAERQFSGTTDAVAFAISAPHVPLPRPIVVGTKGRDVIAVKSALSRAGYIRWGSFTNTWGVYARASCHAFQKDVGLKPAGYGIRTHEKLRNRRNQKNDGWAFNAYATSVMRQEYDRLHRSPEDIIRGNILSMARRIYAYRGSIPYKQVRPFPLIKLTDPVNRLFGGIDCSAYVTICYYAAGALNPNVMGGSRLSWNGQGYTGTLLAGGRKTTRDNLKPGDLVFYGFSTRSTPAFPYGSPTHVALWEGRDGMVYSNGSYPMGRYHYRYRHDVNCYVTYRML